jgi:hypothetical protein
MHSSSSITNLHKNKKILEKKASMENINSNMIKKLHNSKSIVKFEIISDSKKNKIDRVKGKDIMSMNHSNSNIILIINNIF